MKLVDTRMYVGMLRELTEAGKEVSLIVAGSSMAPFWCIIGILSISASQTVR